MESEVSPIRAELDTLIKSPAYLDPFHADNEKARATAQKLYATLYKDEGEEPAPLEEVEGTLSSRKPRRCSGKSGASTTLKPMPKSRRLPP